MVKNPPAHAVNSRDSGSIPESGRSTGVRNGNPLQYSCLENSMEREAWWDTVPGVAESNMTEHTHTNTPKLGSWNRKRSPRWAWLEEPLRGHTKEKKKKKMPRKEEAEDPSENLWQENIPPSLTGLECMPILLACTSLILHRAEPIRLQGEETV